MKCQQVIEQIWTTIDQTYIPPQKNNKKNWNRVCLAPMKKRRPRFTDFHSCSTGKGTFAAGESGGWSSEAWRLDRTWRSASWRWNTSGLEPWFCRKVLVGSCVFLFARPEARNLFVEEINTRQVESSTYQLASKSLPMWYHVEWCVSWRQGSNWWPYTRPQFQSQGSGSTTCQLITEGREIRIFAK